MTGWFKKHLCFGCIFVVVFLTACASSIPKVCRVASDQGAIIEAGLGSQVDSALYKELEQGTFSGSVLILEADKIVLNRGYGCSEQKTLTHITPDAISDIGSLAKTFTAVAILLLEQQGRLSLDDTVGQFYPDAPSHTREITIRQMMLHTAGLKNYLSSSDFTPMTRAQAEEKTLSSSLRSVPGEEYHYSNAGYALLAAIVEHVTQAPFQDYVV